MLLKKTPEINLSLKCILPMKVLHITSCGTNQSTSVCSKYRQLSGEGVAEIQNNIFCRWSEGADGEHRMKKIQESRAVSQ